MPDRTRIVVVGHGMVAARLIDDLDRYADPAALDVTVIGAEPEGAYNRLMLSEVIGGRAAVDGLAMPHRATWVRLLDGVAAVRLDRERQLVVDEHGDEHPYDQVVLATGADPRVPPLAGLEDASRWPSGVHALRTLADCRAVLARVGSVGRAIVLGGGLLGVEAAVGLRAHAVPVTVVHSGAGPLDRQLDAASATVLRHALRDNGIDVVTGGRAAEVVVHDGAVAGLRLADGSVVEGGLLLIATGVRPRSDLAADAGLPCAAGVLVDSDLRSLADPRVSAIGDCAEPPGGCRGLLAPGWDQAAAVARRLARQGDSRSTGPTDGAAAPTGSTPEAAAALMAPAPEAAGGDVIRLKAKDLTVVALGTLPDDDLADTDVHVVTVTDLRSRRRVRVGVRDGVLVGASVVGDAQLAADLTATYERGLPVPADPAQLLLRASEGGGGLPTAQSPALIPGRATVCRCNGVAKSHIVAAHAAGDRTVDDVACRTRATTGCGTCTATVQGLLEWLAEVDGDPASTASDTDDAGLLPRVARPKHSARLGVTTPS